MAEPSRRAAVKGVTRAGALADQAYVSIREAITSGRLPLGSKVTERALAEELGVSATPVREALRQLEQELLVERIGLRERRITHMPDRTRSETVYVYALLRGAAARFAATNASEAELNSITAALERAEAGTKGLAVRDALARFDKFHELVELAAHNPVLKSMIGTAKAFDPSYRDRSVQEQVSLAPEALIERIDDHRPILDAVRARNPDRAEQLMREHQLKAGKSYLRYPGAEEAAV
jgi:DNA-binding GntR family transcriptional regulator